MYLLSTGQQAQIVIWSYIRQDKVACPINCSITTRTSVCKRYHPFYVWCFLFYHSDCFGDAITLAVAWQIIIKCHSVKFDKIIPSCVFDKRLYLPLVY